MSIVQIKAKKLYKNSLVFTFFCLILVNFYFYIFYPTQLLSCIFGSFVAFLPQIVSSYYFLYFQQKFAIQHRAKLLYQTEGLKIGLTVGLFILVFLFFEIKPFGLLVTYFLTILLNNIGLIVFSLLNKSTN